MAKKKIKIEKALLERVQDIYPQEGYSSAEEFVEHAIERALEEIRRRIPEGEEGVRNQLKGLGYIS
jgi:metal-responsive CopG/Arc/MetJ family transcriptional regulator